MRTIRHGARIAALAGILVAAAGAEQGSPGAPLSESKAALRQLQTDRTARESAVGDPQLKEGLPRMETPTPGAGAASIMPPATNGRKGEPGRASPESRNWLLDGIDRLDQKPKANGVRSQRSDQEDQAPLDPNDPDYLLKAYARQREQNATTAREAKEDRAAAPVAGSDPLAPFMKDWLAGSPVDQRVFEQIRGAHGGTGSTFSGRPGEPLPTGIPTSNPAGSFPLPGPDFGLPGRSAALPAANPFLSVESPYGPGAGAAVTGRPPPANVPVPPPQMGGPRPAVEPLPPIPGIERKPPPSTLQDDKKYFPQQRRF